MSGCESERVRMWLADIDVGVVLVCALCVCVPRCGVVNYISLGLYIMWIYWFSWGLELTCALLGADLVKK